MLYIYKLLSVFMSVFFMIGSLFAGLPSLKSGEKPVIGIAWSNNQGSASFTATVRAAEATGAEVLVLRQVRAGYLAYDPDGMLAGETDGNGILSLRAAEKVKKLNYNGSNAAMVMRHVDAVVFPGGADISPSLYAEPEPWHGIEAERDYCAERDVSDHILMSYCLDRDVPVLAICRGMQMLSVVSGAEMIQDIPTYFGTSGADADGIHRDPTRSNFVTHDLEVISRDSLLYRCVNKDRLENCPSWHHQAVKSVEGTALTVTGVTDAGGVRVIEAVERQDKSFVLGVQIHPEIAFVRHVDNAPDADSYMPVDDAISFFDSLVAAV